MLYDQKIMGSISSFFRSFKKEIIESPDVCMFQLTVSPATYLLLSHDATLARICYSCNAFNIKICAPNLFQKYVSVLFGRVLV